MKQTHEHSDWYAGIVAQVRTHTETLLSDYAAMPPPKTPAEVERAAKSLLAVVKLADFADRLSVKGEGEQIVQPQRPLNRHERRRLEALGKPVKSPQELSRPG